MWVHSHAGTAAAGVVAPWVCAAKDRAEAEAALALVKAQVIVMAVSID